MNRQTRTTQIPYHAEVYEARCLLAVAGIAAEVGYVQSGDAEIRLTWQNPSEFTAADYEIWVDQEFSDGLRNRKVYYRSDVSSSTYTYTLGHRLSAGDYTVWIRAKHEAGFTPWANGVFRVDGGDATIPRPSRPEIAAFREGQGSAGQRGSEGGIAWQGDASLYDIWVGRRDGDGRVSEHAAIENVPKQSITLRELALAADKEGRPAFGELLSDTGLSQLVSGTYEFYVRGVNGAVDASGDWVGKGPWSQRFVFEYQRLEGADAVPENLRGSQELRFKVQWDPVPDAELYLVNLWKGPDYSSNQPVNVRIHGSQYIHGDFGYLSNIGDFDVAPGDEVFVRVRAIGSEGMLEDLRPGNFASVTINIPAVVNASDLGTPRITGPEKTTSSMEPVIRWDRVANADSYDVWFSSLESRQRLFYASGISTNHLHLTSSVLAGVSDPPEQSNEFGPSGFSEGRYRVWIRARHSHLGITGNWTDSYDFEIDRSQVKAWDLSNDVAAQDKPLYSPNLVVPYWIDGKEHVLVSNGRGESFGASVLALYRTDDDGGVSRPVGIRLGEQTPSLLFPDLAVGRNVADLAMYGDHHLLVLSRGSNELRLVDLKAWKVVSTLDLTVGAGGVEPDVMDLEVLSNGQILIGANRSNRLRVVDVGDDSELREIRVPEADDDQEGFSLAGGRAVQISAIDNIDGTFTVFMATPAERGIAIAKYNPQQLTLQPARESNGGLLPVISRSPFSSPYVGGIVFHAESINGDKTFYLSTDRNGFLTWIDVETFDHGFIDLVPFIDGASRDVTSGEYRDPNDAEVDPTRLVQIDGNHVAITNNRSRSLILKFQVSDGILQALSAVSTNAGYGAAFATESSRLYATSQSKSILATRLTYVNSEATWGIASVSNTVLSDPIIRASVDPEAINIQYQTSGRSRLTNQSQSDGIVPTKLELFTPSGFAYRDRGGPPTTVVVQDSQQTFLSTHLTLAGADEDGDQHYLGIVNITNVAEPILHSVYAVPETFNWHSVDFRDEQVAVLDRLGGRMLLVKGWQDATSSTAEVISFADRLPSSFGQTRSGKVRMLEDGTNVVLHDTVPDKVFTIFESGATSDVDYVPRVHANHASQWINDLHVLDEDRVLAVSWDAKILILNVRTGVYETIRRLDDDENVELKLFGVLETAYRNGVLSVSSPGAGVVADFQIEKRNDAVGYDVQLIRVTDAPNVVSTLLNDSGRWIVESDRVRYFPWPASL